MRVVTLMPVAPWSPAFLGSAHLSHGLGQAPEEGGFEDLSYSVSQKTWQEMEWTRDQASGAYRTADLLWAIREKAVFSASFFRDLIADPRILGAINANPSGGAFIDAANALVRLVQPLSLTNQMSSVRALIGAMETRILPGLGIAPSGRMPLFRNQAGFARIFDCTAVGGVPPAGAIRLDFGDLCGTSVISDLKTLRSAAADVSFDEAKNVLGDYSDWLAGILTDGRMATYPTADKISDAVEEIVSDSAVRKAVGSVSGAKGQEMAANLATSAVVWAKPAGILKWIIVGAGALAVVYIAVSALRMDWK